MDFEKDNLLEMAGSIIADGNIIFCPSLGEYPVYDELLYNMMCNDSVRMGAYNNVIRKLAKDKTVVEIGTGSKAPLALMCAEAEARIVYAIEADPEAARQADLLIKSRKLEHKIRVITGYSSAVELPEKVDLCVSEIIGNIGGAEGAINILNDAKRFLKDDGRMIPERCLTKIAPAFMPQKIYEDDLMKEVVDGYVRQVYDAVGFEFPLTRYAAYNFPESNIISKPEIFEDINFNLLPEEYLAKTVEFRICADCRFDGLLLWVNLYVDESNVIDTFKSMSWAPVFLRANSLDLKQGDILKVDCVRTLSRNRINPDYFFKGAVLRKNNEKDVFHIESYYTKA